MRVTESARNFEDISQASTNNVNAILPEALNPTDFQGSTHFPVRQRTGRRGENSWRNSNKRRARQIEASLSDI